MATPEQVQQLLEGPSMMPPPDVVPNFVDPPNVYNWFIVTIVLCITLSTLAIVMRIYTKLCIIHKVGWEDYTSILGFLLWIAYCIPTTLIMKNGGGVHQWNVQLKNLINLLYYANVAAILYGITVFFIKLSISLQYLRIFVPSRKNSFMFWAIIAMITFNLMFYIAITLAEIWICTPREKYWNVLIITGHCSNANADNIAAGAVNAFSDFILLLLPQGVIWKLQMPLRRKIGVSAIFLMGLFVCLTSVVRLYYAIRLAQTGDVTYNIAPMGFWTYAELSTGIICGCLPVSPKFFQAVGQKVSSLSKSSSSIGTLLRSSKLTRPSEKHSGGTASGAVDNWRDPYGVCNKLTNNYISLEERSAVDKNLSPSTDGEGV